MQWALTAIHICIPLIKIFPYEQLKGNPVNLPQADIKEDFLWQNRDHLFFYNGKGAIHFLANSLKLKREDEVCILTSTDSTYVATCVSATLFNYCKVSRVLSDKVKAIYIIHEFGLPYPKINEVANFAGKNNIPVIEDCAHSIDSTIHGQRIGTFGDFALYSLSKHLPIRNGGLLVGNKLKVSGVLSSYYNIDEARKVEEAFRQHYRLLPAITELKRQNFSSVRNSFPQLKTVFELNGNISPYFVIFKTPEYKKLYSLLADKDIEWGRTHVENWFCIPTQPFMGQNKLNEMVSLLKQYV